MKTVINKLYVILFVILMPMQIAAAPPAVPVGSVHAQSLDPPPSKNKPAQSKTLKDFKSLIFSAKKEEIKVLELFSTQACTFCPKADAMMKDLVNREDLIALSCHVDYFDVKQGSLSLPICSTRQIAYEKSMKAPKYTPQMVVNGQYDAIGYLLSEVETAFKQAQEKPVTRFQATKNAENSFEATLPKIDKGDYKLWLFVFDLPKTITVADGANRGKEMTYYNIVSNVGLLGTWNGETKTLRFDPKLTETSKGFALIAQDTKTNHITAASQFLR